MERGGWSAYASQVLKDLMHANRVNYRQLSQRLAAIGIKENPRQLTNKVNRGLFPFFFFLQCLRALNLNLSEVDWLSLEHQNPPPQPIEDGSGEHSGNKRRAFGGDV